MNAEWTRIYVPQLPTAGATRNECRERAAEIKAENEAQRHRAKSEQSSDRYTAQERIRLWESLHGAQLPRDANHPVLTVIAFNTALTLAQVRAEQQHRFGSAAGAASSAAD
jgi:transcription elongation GreA/GreB family factor